MRLAYVGAIMALAVLLARCGAPEVQAPPTARSAVVLSPTAAPTATTVAPALARATATLLPTELPAATAAPTWVAATFEPPVETPPPPTPDAPLGEALRRFDGNALLYTRPDRFLMLTDA